MRNTPNADVAVLDAHDIPAVNTEASLILTPEAGEHIVLWDIQASYSAAPTAGSSVIVVWDGVIHAVSYMSAGGLTALSFPRGLKAPPDTAVTVTLGAGGAGVSGALGIQYS